MESYCGREFVSQRLPLLFGAEHAFVIPERAPFIDLLFEILETTAESSFGLWIEDLGDVGGPERATFNMRTAVLSRKHAYTAWLVIVNNPSACDPTPCTAPDILNNPDTESQITFADGRAARGRIGRLTFRAHVPVGEVAGWLDDRFFFNPLGAEIHVVINDHGPVLAEYMPDMIRTYRGGCTDESLPPIFPPSAFADGEPGPNACQLYKVVIFQQ